LKVYFVWASSARAELRHIDREMAMRILIALTVSLKPGKVTSKRWKGNLPALKLAGFLSDIFILFPDFNIRMDKGPLRHLTSHQLLACDAHLHGSVWTIPDIRRGRLTEEALPAAGAPRSPSDRS
jgi:hypothetical protein